MTEDLSGSQVKVPEVPQRPPITVFDRLNRSPISPEVVFMELLPAKDAQVAELADASRRLAVAHNIPTRFEMGGTHYEVFSPGKSAQALATDLADILTVENGSRKIASPRLVFPIETRSGDVYEVVRDLEAAHKVSISIHIGPSKFPVKTS